MLIADMPPAFLQAVEIVLREEGGYVHDVSDPGGETKFGISKRSYPELDIRNLARDDAVRIYFRDYWQKNRLSEMPYWLALLAFDAVVNQGPRAIGWMQGQLGVTRDNAVGRETIDAAHRATPLEEGARFVGDRAYAYGMNINFKKFGQGWMNRLSRISILAGIGYYNSQPKKETT